MKTNQSIFEEINRNMESVRASFNKFAQMVDQSKKKSPALFTFLAKHGWYLPFEIEPYMIIELATLAESKSFEQINQKLIEFYDTEINFFSRVLNERFPERANAINQAIDAHGSGKYYLSIPVFFSQAEGMCEELTGKRFFGTKHNIPHTAEWVEELKLDSFLKLFTNPMKQVGLTRQKQDLVNSPIGCNRHDVLHGRSLDYGTDLNSYKSLSLLFYIGDAVYLMHEDQKQ